MTVKHNEQPDSDLPIELSNPARRALIQAGYWRLDQLAAVSEVEVKQLHGVGPKTLVQLHRALALKGLSFADEKNRKK